MTYDCAETFRRMQDYLDRELSADEMTLVEAHLANCGMCAEEYVFEASFLRHVRGGLASPEPPADLAEIVFSRF